VRVLGVGGKEDAPQRHRGFYISNCEYRISNYLHPTPIPYTHLITLRLRAFAGKILRLCELCVSVVK
jgi:hypothetical protein